MTINPRYVDWHLARMGMHPETKGCFKTQLPVVPTLQEYFYSNSLTRDQGYWLALCFGLSYNLAASYHLFNLYPNVDEIDIKELEEWWFREGRTGERSLMIDKDRRWVRSLNYLVPCIKQYKEQYSTVGSQTQFFDNLINNSENSYTRYSKVYDWANGLPSFGQFALFLYTEGIYAFGGLDIKPETLSLKESPTPRKGVAYACNLPWTDSDVPALGWSLLQAGLHQIRGLFVNHSNIWDIETTLCDWAKFNKNPKKEWHNWDFSCEGYQIAKKELEIPEIDWNPLWEARKRIIPKDWRIEEHYSKEKLSKGIPTEWSEHWVNFTRGLHG